MRRGISTILLFSFITTFSQTQIGDDIDGGEINSESFGAAIALSADGSIMAIGAPNNHDVGTNAGHVRVYESLAGVWTLIGGDINAEAVGDNFGGAVALSSDGTILAVGADQNDGNGTSSGHVRVYENISGTWIQIGQDIDGENTFDQSGQSVDLSADGSIVAIGAHRNDGTGSNAGHVRIFENIAGTWTQIGSDIDGEAAGDQLGWSVSLSDAGDIVAIGANFNDGNGNGSGHVRVYENIAGTWTQIGVDIDGEAAEDLSGSSVDISSDGTIVAIGASRNSDAATQAGHVRIYENISGTWTQIGQDIDGYNLGDLSGDAVSISSDGSKVAIGAIFNDDNGENSGQVRIYEFISGTWFLIDQDILGLENGDLNGSSVALSDNGSIVAMGASGNNDAGYNIGHVRAFEDISGTWTQLGSTINGGGTLGPGDNSGIVDLSQDGSIVAIGATGNDGNGSNSGHVRVYENQAGSWIQIGQDIDGEDSGDRSGLAVALSDTGDIVAIGAGINAGNGNSSGHVRVYENISGTWTQIGQDIDGEAPSDVAGSAISLSADGSILAVGARLNDGAGSSSGHVRIFENLGGTWTQIGLDINGEAAADQLGHAVDLSDDGTIVAIGAPFNDGNGPGSGHVRIYENIAGTWTQVGQDIDGEAAGDSFGYSVALSSDGSIVAAGARGNDANGGNAGHVRIFENIAGVWTQIGTDIDGEAAADDSGYAIDISSDGSIVAIGARTNDGTATSSGHVRVYENIAGTWTQKGSDIDGEAASDVSGQYVALSGNGFTVAIGAPFNDGNGQDAGHVRVYEFALILPVDFISFQGKSISEGIELIWKTAQEENNHGFELERSADGIEWQTIHIEQAKGNTSINNYSFLDTQPKEGLNYYRLKQIDMNGQFTFSDVVALEWTKFKRVEIIFPNPSKNHVEVLIQNPKGSAFRLSAIAPSGEVVWQSPQITNQTTWSHNLALQPGIYFLRLQTPYQTITERVVIISD
ncbi:MAG: T9SS type A sorting domain-containing protein [Saprospiraceae bacterium]|nr:T9SS type A sorting domain-containing protein [Saprospiraceae bacterium]